MCVPVPQGKACSRQFPLVWELLFQAPTPRPGKFNKYMEHQGSSVNAEFTPRFAAAHTASLGSLQRQEPSPALRALSALLFWAACSPFSTRIVALPKPASQPRPSLWTHLWAPSSPGAGPSLPPPPFSSLLPSLPSSYSPPSLPAPAPGNGLDPGSQRPDP